MIGRKKSIFDRTPAPKQANASGLHRKVLIVLREACNGLTVLEEERIECVVEGSRKALPVDIVLPDLKVAIEVHGQQHYEYSPHFHTSLDAFKQQRKRDAAKKDAIIAAGFAYLAIPYNQVDKLDGDSLMGMITEAIKGN